MKIVFVDACVRGKESRTWSLCQEFLRKYPEDYVEHVDLQKLKLQPLGNGEIKYRTQCITDGKLEDSIFDLAHQFAEADLILIGAPYWDLAFPAMLKVYIEHIMCGNVTFCYTDTGAKGMCKAKKLVYVAAVGGYIQGKNLGYEYIQQIAAMLGIEECCYYDVQGLDVYGNDVEKLMEDGKNKILTIKN